MGFTPLNLEIPEQILLGFNGASTMSLGDIVLLVQVGPVTLNVQFLVVEDLSPFNTILGHAWLHGMKVIPSTYHQMVSYLTEDGQINLYGSQLAEPNEARRLEWTLQRNKDVFAWTHSDMPEIHPLIASHRLNILPSSRPIGQKVRWFHPDRQRIIQDEIDKLLAARFIREVEHPDWLAKVVVVLKKVGNGESASIPLTSTTFALKTTFSYHG
ncbi:hypothetical protein AAG906_008610 [Vitis piasezkii]